MFKKIHLGTVIFALILIATSAGSVLAGTLPPIQGVWTCTVLRAGTVQRPLMYTFNSDGNFNYSSATTINSTVAGPVQDSGFHSRGGSRGQWTKVGTNVFNYQSVEFLYDANGNLIYTIDGLGNALLGDNPTSSAISALVAAHHHVTTTVYDAPVPVTDVIAAPVTPVWASVKLAVVRPVMVTGSPGAAAGWDRGRFSVSGRAAAVNRGG